MKTKKSLFTALVIGSVLTLPLKVLAAEAPSCPSMKKVEFSAKFYMKADNHLAPSSPMKLKIGDDVAEIFSGQKCQAVCKIRNVDKGLTDTPSAMDLQCQGTQLASLSTNASVIFKHDSARPVLRFGTWLDGYKDAVLKVELDRFSTQKPVMDLERSIAQVHE